MKTKSYGLRSFILTLFVAAIMSAAAYSQGTDSRRVLQNNDKFYIGILVSPQQTSILNEGFSSSMTAVKGMSMNISADAGIFFSKFVGISFGAGLNPFSTELSLPSYTAEKSATDDDSPPESYVLQIEGESITEIQNISFLSIPVSLAFRVPAGSKFGFFVNAGVSAEIPVVKAYEGKGTFSYDGYYSQYPVTLEDIPEYGFYSDLVTNVPDGELEIKPFNAAIAASGGFYFYLGSAVQASLGVRYNKSLSNISNYSGTNFYLTTKANEINSMMGGCTDTGIQALGLSVGIRYFIK